MNDKKNKKRRLEEEETAHTQCEILKEIGVLLAEADSHYQIAQARQAIASKILEKATAYYSKAHWYIQKGTLGGSSKEEKKAKRLSKINLEKGKLENQKYQAEMEAANQDCIIAQTLRHQANLIRNHKTLDC